MKHSILIVCFAVIFVTVINGNAVAGWQDILDSAAPSSDAEQVSQAPVSAGGLMQNGSLTDLLMAKTGVSQSQAQSGAGALFQMAKSHMQAAAFTKLEQSVPGMQGLLAAAPAVGQSSALGGLAGSLSSVAGGSGGSAASLMSLAAAFQQQGMSPQMVQQFIPIVVDYVKNNAGNALAGSLGSALTGQ